MSEIDPPTSEEQEEALRLFRLVHDAVVAEIGQPSRWSGRVRVVGMEAAYYGRITSAGDVELRVDRLRHESLRWRTMVHEALHAVSPGYNTLRYNDLAGWEEAPVEMLTRILSPRLAERAGIELDEPLLQEESRVSPLSPYVEATERLRVELSIDREPFYRDLLARPIAERPAYVGGIINMTLSGTERMQAILIWSRARTVMSRRPG